GVHPGLERLRRHVSGSFPAQDPQRVSVAVCAVKTAACPGPWFRRVNALERLNTSTEREHVMVELAAARQGAAEDLPFTRAISEGVLTITLNRPPAHSLSMAMIAALRQEFD